MSLQTIATLGLPLIAIGAALVALQFTKHRAEEIKAREEAARRAATR
ncbi:hypothetical protein [Methylobacterium nodulans]|uniref:Uncharacterized protein n=1 Tax=Methylobacterium nodulans (strain LMG 21967 / CNCM I-2342 / ORS 2060) TaxID=460265 RepID=B8IPV1_METNO|nr:hypothetical protein [Methylobacterium nodulans]ACL56601.1 hypothetical protein Mnod_1611 [Methylobacterium nodulans ORS 2060]